MLWDLLVGRKAEQVLQVLDVLDGQPILGPENIYQGLFLDTFPPNQLNSSWRFSSFLGFWPEFFQDIARVLSFYFHQK